MDVLAGQTFSALLPVTASAVRAELPADRPRPAQLDDAGALVRLELDEELAAAVKAL